MNLEKLVTHTLNESLSTKKAFWDSEKDHFLTVTELIVDRLKAGSKILIFGNGGSACDALHFSGELVNRYVKDRPALPCIALTADAPLITCIGNDYSFDVIFERQVNALAQKGDLVIGISTSGNSKNVVLGLAAAKAKGAHSVALTGGTGGKILSEKLADHVLHVGASKVTARIQETHEWILHSICECIDAKLYP